MIYGYARISTTTQNIERQIRNIKVAYPTAIIIQEAYTGTKIDRPLFDKLLSKIKADDTIVFDSVSRMSRNASDGFDLYEKLFYDGVNLVFLKEPHIDTATYKKALTNQLEMTGNKVDYILEGINKYLLELAKEQIRLAFDQSQKEVDDLRQRTKEGIETARLNDKQIGQKPGIKLHIKAKEPVCNAIIKYSKNFNGSNTDSEVIAIINNSLNYEVVINNKKETKSLKVSRNTYYKYKKELKEQREINGIDA